MVAPGALVLLLKYAGTGAGASSGPGTRVLLDISAEECFLISRILLNQSTESQRKPP